MNSPNVFNCSSEVADVSRLQSITWGQLRAEIADFFHCKYLAVRFDHDLRPCIQNAREDTYMRYNTTIGIVIRIKNKASQRLITISARRWYPLHHCLQQLHHAAPTFPGYQQYPIARN